MICMTRRWLALLAALLLGACATPATVTPYVGTYVAGGGGDTMHVRVAPDGRVDFFAPSNGAAVSGHAAFGVGGGRNGFTGLLPGGQVFGFSGERTSPGLWIGAQTFVLRPLPPQLFGVGAPAAPPDTGSAVAGGAGGRAGGSGSLAGLRLSMAKGGNGYFTERSYDLCADGRVFMRWAELQTSHLGSGGGERTDHGRWSQTGATLQLSLARAGQTSFTVQHPEPGVVRLDGTAYQAQRNARCR